MMRPHAWSGRPSRWILGAAVLGAVLWRTGSGPFVSGVQALDVRTLVLGAGIAVVTTVACAWRWHLVANGMGVAIRMRPAIWSYYRAQFLNTVLPGGVLGDVHRGVLHGHSAGDRSRTLRAVAWERFAGQVVHVVLAMVVLLLLSSPVPRVLPAVTALLAAVLVIGASVARRTWRMRTSRLGRVLRAVRDEIRVGLLLRRSWPGVTLASAVAVTGHVATYLVAARAVGVTAPLVTLLPLAVLVLLGAGLPLNLAGWGPREGMAAWAFAAAGIGAGQGVATAVAYGAMVLVANLPGAVVLMVTVLHSAGLRSPERAFGYSTETQAEVQLRRHPPPGVEGRSGRGATLSGKMPPCSSAATTRSSRSARRTSTGRARQSRSTTTTSSAC
jgi:glycosyltransferase 2 family protein